MPVSLAQKRPNRMKTIRSLNPWSVSLSQVLLTLRAKEREGRKIVPLLACIGQLIPWLKQWHNELDPVYGTRMGDYFEDYLAEEAKALGMTVAEVMAWKPPEMPRRRGGRRRGADGG